MVIYHVNGQTLCDQKLKISGTSSPSRLYQSRKHQSRAGRGCSPAKGSCQWHLHISLPGCTGAVQTDWYFLCFLSTFPSSPLMWQLPSINFLKKQYHKKPEQCQKLHLGFEFLCHPLVPNVLLSPCLLANLKTGISKVLVTHAKWFQILNQIFANKKAVYFHHFSVLNTDSTRANSLMSNCYSLQSQHVPSVKPVRAIQNTPPIILPLITSVTMFYLTVPVQSYFFPLFKWLQKKKTTASMFSFRIHFDGVWGSHFN